MLSFPSSQDYLYLIFWQSSLLSTCILQLYQSHPVLFEVFLQVLLHKQLHDQSLDKLRSWIWSMHAITASGKSKVCNRDHIYAYDCLLLWLRLISWVLRHDLHFLNTARCLYAIFNPTDQPDLESVRCRIQSDFWVAYWTVAHSNARPTLPSR